jgi:CBS domain-containing protein
MKIDFETTVSEIMQGIETDATDGNPHVVVALPNYPLSRAQEWFARYDVHHLPIVEDLDSQVVVGMISTVDIVHFYANNPGADLSKVPIGEIMVKNPDTITPDTSIREANHMLARANYQSLPVVNRQGASVGIVTTRDIVAFVDSQLYPD